MRPLPLCAPSAFTGTFKTLAFALFLPLLFLCSASTASADPVVITGGGAATQPGLGNFSLSVTGTNFAFSGADLSSPKPQLCGPCTPGTQFGGTIAVRIDLVTGLVYNGTTYQNGPFAQGFIIVSTGNFITVPVFTIPLDLSPVVTPFSFVGRIGVNPLDGSAPFQLDLTGMGTATFTFAGQGSSIISQARFAFAPPPEPVPEPATMILLGTGLAGVVARVRRRRKE